MVSVRPSDGTGEGAGRAGGAGGDGGIGPGGIGMVLVGGGVAFSGLHGYGDSAGIIHTPGITPGSSFRIQDVGRSYRCHRIDGQNGFPWDRIRRSSNHPKYR